MKVLAAADLHFNRQQFAWLADAAAGCDVVVIAGDLLDFAGHRPIPEQIAEVRPLLGRLRERARVVVASGNHDADAATAGGEGWARWVAELTALDVLPDGTGADFGDLRLTVCPWWNGAEVRGRMLAQLESESVAAHGRRWLWIHHAPPRGSRIAWTRRGNAGDPFLAKLIGRHQPEAVLCGHIHEAPFYPDGGWSERLGRTWVFNPGKQPGGVPTCITLDLAVRTAEYRSAGRTETLDLAAPAAAPSAPTE